MADLREILRSLRLPLPAPREDEALAAVTAQLHADGFDGDDAVARLQLLSRRWRDLGVASADLASYVRLAIDASNDRNGLKLIARKYFTLHRDLQKLNLTFDEATALISHADLAVGLTVDQSMSAAQVARILSAREPNAYVPWKAAQTLLKAARVEPALDADEVQAMWAADAAGLRDMFADADRVEAAEVVGTVAGELGFRQDLTELLLALHPADAPPFFPYLQTLHLQAVIAGSFDHPTSVLYEFTPRGKVAKWAFSQYPANLVPTGNPVLNNFKAVEAVDLAWARSRRQGQALAAHALVGVLMGMETMAFLPRKSLAAFLRGWCLRVLDLSKAPTVLVPAVPTDAQVGRVLDAVALGGTETVGVIEQRVVDALSSILNTEPDGWRSRGLGDSVNASNLSRRKLGDCDYQKADERLVVAYEAHAGVLTDAYLSDHLHSLKRSLRARAEAEWLGIADASEWTLRIVFVAHEFALPPPVLDPADFFDVTVELTFTTYADFVAQCQLAGDVRAAFESHVNPKLNRRQTPASVRQRFLDLSA